LLIHVRCTKFKKSAPLNLTAFRRRESWPDSERNLKPKPSGGLTPFQLAE